MARGRNHLTITAPQHAALRETLRASWAQHGGGVHSGRVGALRAGVGIGGELGQGRKDDLPPSRVGVDGRVDGLRRCRRQGVGDAGIRGADVGWW